MKLSAYLSRENLDQAEFAARLIRADGSVVSQAAVSRYASGKQIPDREIMPLIVAAAGGDVTPNDFFDIPAPVRAAEPAEASP
jgi:transcriptional regulator with XRE-family HTH domain